MGKKWITILIISLITVFIWVGFEVYFRMTSKDVQEDYANYLEPIEPTIDEEIVKEVLDREEKNVIVNRDDLE